MLTNLTNLQQIPGLSAAQVDPDWLNTILVQADATVKVFCKQNLEQQTLVEYYSGTGIPDLVLRQFPVSTITSLYLDPNGFWGQAPGGFGAGTLLTPGVNYALVLDDGGTVSNRGIVKMIGGAGQGYGPWWPEFQYQGKLAAYRLPFWPWGQGNIKVTYQAGYNPIPVDLTAACNMLCAWMVRNIPNGEAMQSESLGGYSYSATTYAALGTVPELGTVVTTLRRYREISFGTP